MTNYWLHRISHKSEASYPLLEEGYLSIGFSEVFTNEKFLKTLRDFSSEDEACRKLTEIIGDYLEQGIIYGDICMNLK